MVKNAQRTGVDCSIDIQYAKDARTYNLRKKRNGKYAKNKR